MTYVAPLWRPFVAALDGSGITDYSKLTSDRAIEVTLNAPLMAEGTVPSDNPQVWIPYDDVYDDPYLDEGTRLMWWFRRESLTPPYYAVRAATLVNLVHDVAAQDNARTRFVGHDPWMLLFSRLVRTEAGALPGEDGISWTATKVAIIIGQIIRNTINYPTPGDGHCFLDAGDGSRIGEGSQYGDWGGTAFYAGTLEALPVIDYNISQGTSVGQAMQDLCAAGHCDIVLTPIYDPLNRPNYLCELNVYVEAGQTRDEAIFAWNLPGRSLVGVDRQQDGAQRVNRFYAEAGPGGVTGAAPVQEDTASITKFGPYEGRQFYPAYRGNGAVTAVTGLAEQQVALRAEGRQTVTIRPAPERSPRPWQDYGLGDRVPTWAGPTKFRKLLGSF